MSQPTRVLVIGGLGFIGLSLTDRLVRDGHHVTVVTPVRARHLERAAAFEARGVRVLEGDLRLTDSLVPALPGQDLIFNLAGESGAVRSMENPVADLEANCRGNLVLLESLRVHNPTAKLVFVGSRLQYGKQAMQPVHEDQVPDPLCLHAIHKSTVEQYLRLYGTLYGLRYAIARVTNPYGPGQPKGRVAYGVVNRMIHLALDDQAITIYGDGAQQRDYIYVDDLVSALVAIGASTASDGRAFNVGSGVGTRMIDMAAAIIEIAGGGRVAHVEWPPLAGQIETGDFIADVSRIGRELRWSPTTSLRDGLEKTVAAYRARVSS